MARAARASPRALQIAPPDQLIAIGVLCDEVDEAVVAGSRRASSILVVELDQEYALAATVLRRLHQVDHALEPGATRELGP